MNETPPDDGMEKARGRCTALVDNARSLILGTVSANGEPLASVVPFAREPDGGLLIAVSGLAAHAAHLARIADICRRDSAANNDGQSAVPVAAEPLLQGTAVVSAMLIEDEAASRQIFARTRLTLRCRVELQSGEDRARGFSRLRERFGEIVGVLEGLPDFVAYRLAPLDGVFVMGFGAAFDLASGDLSSLTPIRSERPAPLAQQD